MMRVVFLDKKRYTYEAIESVTHFHIDHLNNRKCFVLYTEDGIKTMPCSGYDLHKVDC